MIDDDEDAEKKIEDNDSEKLVISFESHHTESSNGSTLTVNRTSSSSLTKIRWRDSTPGGWLWDKYEIENLSEDGAVSEKVDIDDAPKKPFQRKNEKWVKPIANPIDDDIEDI